MDKLATIPMIEVSKPMKLQLLDLYDESCIAPDYRSSLERLLPNQVQAAMGDYQMRVESVLGIFVW